MADLTLIRLQPVDPRGLPVRYNGFVAYVRVVDGVARVRGGAVEDQEVTQNATIEVYEGHRERLDILLAGIEPQIVEVDRQIAQVDSVGFTPRPRGVDR
jgi:hypothetical protein